MLLSIIIVDYHTTQRVRWLAKQLTHPDWEVVVVDNNEENRGYGGGINYGVSQATGTHLLFLNPDVEISVAQVQALLTYLHAHRDVVAIGPQFVDLEGKVVPSCLGRLTWTGAALGLCSLQRFFTWHSAVRSFWLSDWDRQSTRDVATLNGACLMVRRADFEQVGGFDESFFLYWEENDLCDRLRQTGNKLVFLADVCVQHEREVSMKESPLNTTQVFGESRWLYFQKTFGFFRAILLILWITLWESGREILLFGFALFPRLFQLNRIRVIPDVTRDYQVAIAFLQGKGIPLLGIPSSVPRFSQGPLNIWFDAFAFKVGGIHPAAPVVFAGLVTSFSVVLLYRLLQRYVSKHIAFVASLLLVVAPAAISQSRMPFYLFAIPLFTLFFLRSLMRLERKTASSVFFAVLAFCLLFQWELATIPFLAVLLVAFYRNRIRVERHWIPMVFGAVIGLSPQLLFDVMHRCQQLCQFVVWMGYRTVAVSGVDGRHRLTIFSTSFWHSVFGQMSQVMGGGVMLPIVVAVLLFVGTMMTLRMRRMPLLYGYTWMACGALFLGLVIHGDPSEAYFPPFLVLIPILLGFALATIPRRVSILLSYVLMGLLVGSAYVWISSLVFIPILP